MFESSVVLDSSQAHDAIREAYLKFESSVVLDSSQARCARIARTQGLRVV